MEAPARSQASEVSQDPPARQLVVCCDGTWAVPEQDCPTNIGRIAYLAANTDDDVLKGRERLVHYTRGVGGRGHLFDKMLGGGFGLGLEADIKDAYAFLAANYQPNDEIYIFGFSRGAFTARSLVSMVNLAGLLMRENTNKIGAAYRYYREPEKTPDVNGLIHPRGDVRVKLLGMFDTVGALGVPFVGLGKSRKFKNACLPDIVENARQALAIDETRSIFSPTVWTDLRDDEDTGKPCPCNDHGHPGRIVQAWFNGAHADVGGGYNLRSYRHDDSGHHDGHLGYFTLDWMLAEADSLGLQLDPARKKAELATLRTNRKDGKQLYLIHDSMNVGYWLMDKLRYALKVVARGDHRFHRRYIRHSAAVSQRLHGSVLDAYGEDPGHTIQIVRGRLSPHRLRRRKLDLRRNKELREILEPSPVDITPVVRAKGRITVQLLGVVVGLALVAALVASLNYASIWSTLGDGVDAAADGIGGVTMSIVDHPWRSIAVVAALIAVVAALYIWYLLLTALKRLNTSWAFDSD